MGLKRMHLLAGAGAAGLALAAAAVAGTRGPSATPLLDSDFGRVRREALALFPRGVPVDGVAASLGKLGFQCTPIRRVAPNISAPFVQCDSAGRGYPYVSRMQITVMGRNGAVSDIAVGGGIDAEVADARTPDPTAAAVAEAEPRPAHGEGNAAKHSSH